MGKNGGGGAPFGKISLPGPNPPFPSVLMLQNPLSPFFRFFYEVHNVAEGKALLGLYIPIDRESFEEWHG